MPKRPPKLPNVVLFVSDQQRADTMPGEAPIAAHTPHAAWLMERGTTFRNAFCTSPLCAPGRSSILTGLYPHATGVVANYDERPPKLSMKEGVKVLADRLRPEGYACAYTGKWHLPTGDDRGGFLDCVARVGKWDVDSPESDDAIRFGERVGVDMGTTYTDHLNTSPAPQPTDGRTTKMPLAFHPATLMAQKAAAFIRRMETADKPFALVHSCIEPHPLGRVSRISPCPFDRMYDPADMPLPATLRQADAPLIARRRNMPGLLPTDEYGDEWIQDYIAGYYGAVSYVDHLLGILLLALIDTGQFDNTLVIFTSDHGEMLGDHRMLKKGPIMFEEMIRVPMIVKCPGPSRARETRRLISHVDLVPTILDYCQIPTNEELHGSSIRGLIEGDATPVRDGVPVQYHSRHWGEPPVPLRCWRTEDWKYVETIDGDDELYGLRSDPAETRNLMADPGATSTVESMRAELYAGLKAIDDPWPEMAMPPVIHDWQPGPWDRLAQGPQPRRAQACTKGTGVLGPDEDAADPQGAGAGDRVAPPPRLPSP